MGRHRGDGTDPLTGAGGSAVWLNEYHADFLVRNRLASARRSAARRHLAEVVRAAGRRGAGAPPTEARLQTEVVRAAGRRGAGAPPTEAPLEAMVGHLRRRLWPRLAAALARVGRRLGLARALGGS